MLPVNMDIPGTSCFGNSSDVLRGRRIGNVDNLKSVGRCRQVHNAIVNSESHGSVITPVCYSSWPTGIADIQDIQPDLTGKVDVRTMHTDLPSCCFIIVFANLLGAGGIIDIGNDQTRLGRHVGQAFLEDNAECDPGG